MDRDESGNGDILMAKPLMLKNGGLLDDHDDGVALDGSEKPDSSPEKRTDADLSEDLTANKNAGATTGSDLGGGGGGDASVGDGLADGGDSGAGDVIEGKLVRYTIEELMVLANHKSSLQRPNFSHSKEVQVRIGRLIFSPVLFCYT